MEVPKNFKKLRKLVVQNIAQYSAVNMPFPVLFPTDIHLFHTICHVYKAKPCFSAAPVRSAHDRETRLWTSHWLVNTCNGPGADLILYQSF